MSYSHKQIKKFSLEGEIYEDSAIPRLKDQYIFMVISGMKHKGYVPRYDIDPDFSISYNGKVFEFKLSVYGVYVGKKQAKCLYGIDKNTPVKSIIIQKVKSEEVS
jgi:hypothetical protein